MSAHVNFGVRQIGGDSEPFIILEAGINHNGRLDLALDMVHLARELAADAIKFQTFRAEEFVGDPNLTYTYTSQGREVTESMLEMFRRHEFSKDQWRQIKESCDDAGVMFLSTPQNPTDLELLLKLGVPAVKVGSDDFNNIPLLKRYAQTGLPLILSCGMADRDDIAAALDAVGANSGYPTVLLVCTSQYPTPPADANVARVKTIREIFPNVVVGFSDHTQGAEAAIIAASLGARVFEKHFTLDHNLPGPDHWFSEDPESARAWIAAIRAAPVFLGSGRLEPTAAEREMRMLARRSVTALRDIAIGEIFTECNVGLRRPGTGLAPAELPTVLGTRARRPINAGEQLTRVDYMAKP